MIPTKFKKHPIDRTGNHPDNFIGNERHTVDSYTRIIVPEYGYYYEKSLVVRSNNKVLSPGVDYRPDDIHPEYTRETGLSVMTSILLLNDSITGEVTIDYQCYGYADDFTPNLAKDLLEEISKGLTVDYRNLKEVPKEFTPEYHRHFIGGDNIYGWDGLLNSIREYAHALMMLFNAWLYERNKMHYDWYVESTLKYERDLGSVVTELNSVKPKFDALLRKQNEVDRKLNAHTQMIQGAIDQLNFDRERAKDDYETHKEALSQQFNQLGDALTASIANAKSSMDRVLALANNFETITGSTQKAEQAKTEAEAYAKQYADQLFGNTPDLIAEGDRVTLEVAKTHAVEKINELKKVLSKVDDDIRSSIRHLDAMVIDHYNFFNNKFSEMKTSLETQMGDLIKSIAKTSTNDSETTVNNKYVYVNSNGVTPISNILEFRFKNYRIETYNIAGIGSGLKLPNMISPAVFTNAITIAKSGHGFNDHGQYGVMSVDYGNNQVEQNSNRFNTTTIRFTNLPIEAGDFIIRDIGAITSSVTLRRTDGRISLKSLIKNIIELIPARQSNVSTWRTDDVPKFFTDGLVSVNKLALGNKARLEMQGDWILTDKAIKSPDFALTASDKRLKENIQPLKNALSKVNFLRGYSYEMTLTGRKSVGLIAQEVEEVMPELVQTEVKSGYKSLAYSGVIPYLVEAINELTKQNKQLEARLSLLEHKLSML